MNAPLKIGLASVLALATISPALAQDYRPTAQYQRDLDRYQSDRAAYDANRGDYQQARRDYERRRADWEAARDDYDRRYGYGSYVRIYGPAPVWDETRWAPAPAAGYYGRDTAYTAAAGCRSNNSSSVAGGIIGALAGAALGSNVAANGRGTEGAVLGAVVGGGIGAAVGHANDKYRCDSYGPYYSYNDTIPYREAREYRSGRYDYAYYNRQRCRLAAAPIDRYGEDYRYVRVCPDRQGRYRITG
ncbi:MAG: glycine zipper domain-containing protein [Phenylobacterium sp.]